MPSCLWHSVYHLLTVAALSHSQVPFATTLWIPLGFILFFASVLCIFLLSCYIFAAADVERHQSCLLSNFLLSIAPDSHRHCWMFPSLFRERLCSAGDLAPTALVCSFLSVCSSRSFSLSESQIPMNTYVFLAAKKKKNLTPICWDGGFLWEVVKSSQWFLNFGRPDQFGVVEREDTERNLCIFWSWGMSSLDVPLFHLPLRKQAFHQQSFCSPKICGG